MSSNEGEKQNKKIVVVAGKDNWLKSLGKPYVETIKQTNPYIEHLTFDEFKQLNFRP